METEKTQASKSAKTGALPKRVTISPVKFVILSWVTLGFYHAYWAWRVWETVRRSNSDTYGFKSSLRGWFLVFANFLLFPQLQSIAEKKGIKVKDRAKLLALIYAVTCIAGNNQEAPLELTVASVVIAPFILLPYVKLHNKYVEATKGKYTPSSNNWWLIAAIILGLVVTSLIYGSA